MKPTIEITDANFETEVLKSKQPVLVDFWADWCGPCKMLAPLLDEIATEKAGSAKVANSMWTNTPRWLSALASSPSQCYSTSPTVKYGINP